MVNPFLYAKLPYDVTTDLAPVSITARGPLVLAVHPSVPARTLPEFLAWVRARPGALSYASAGIGTPVHLAIEMLKSAAQLDIVHVPDKGGGPAKTPAAVVRRLHETLAGVVASPEITERLGGLAMEVVNTDPDRTAAILKDELALWAKVVRSTGARAE